MKCEAADLVAEGLRSKVGPWASQMSILNVVLSYLDL
jgi:hypothetical protein